MYDYKLTRMRNLTTATLVVAFMVSSALTYYYRREMEDAIVQRDQAVREISDRALLIEKTQAGDGENVYPYNQGAITIRKSGSLITTSISDDDYSRPLSNFGMSGMPLPAIGMIQPRGEKLVIEDLRSLDKRMVDADLRLRKLEERQR